MKPKTIEIDGTTYIVMQDDKPVYVDDDGTEKVIDLNAHLAKIEELNAEAARRRSKGKEATDKLEAFGDMDPEEARKALETVKNLDDKKLVDAGEVERIKAEVRAQAGEAQKVLEAENEELRADLNNTLLAGAFASSKFVQEKLTLPAEIAQTTFGKAFKVEKRQVIPIDANGEPLYSEENPTVLASFDEGLARAVGAYAHKDQILAKANKPGAGGGNGQPFHGKTVTRADFNELSPVRQASVAAQAAKGELQIVD